MNKESEKTFFQRRYSNGQQVAHKRRSTSLSIREMQIKTTMRYYATLVRMAINLKSTNNCYKLLKEGININLNIKLALQY